MPFPYVNMKGHKKKRICAEPLITLQRRRGCAYSADRFRLPITNRALVFAVSVLRTSPEHSSDQLAPFQNKHGAKLSCHSKLGRAVPTLVSS